MQSPHGVVGVRWKTLPLSGALRMLGVHRADGQHAGGGGGEGKIRLAKIPFPVVGGGCSQEDFKYFKRSWKQYIRSSNETNDVKLRDKSLHCPDEALKKALDRALGDRFDSISVVDLLEEIETLAVVRQSNHVNMWALMTGKQERDEPVCQFSACLRCLAAV
jgi:hypothetical protein